MLRPSYAELMEVLNRKTGEDNEVTSRYTIVIAAAKRARQLIDGDEPMVPEKKGKPLSTAVEEIWDAKIDVVPEGEGTVLNLGKVEDIDDFDFESDFKNIAENSNSDSSVEVLNQIDFDDDEEE